MVINLLADLLANTGIVSSVITSSKKRLELQESIEAKVDKLIKDDSSDEINNWLHMPREEALYAVSYLFKKALPNIFQGKFAFLDGVIRHFQITGDDIKDIVRNGGIRMNEIN